jgi:hypothetical protein
MIKKKSIIVVLIHSISLASQPNGQLQKPEQPKSEAKEESKSKSPNYRNLRHLVVQTRPNTDLTAKRDSSGKVKSADAKLCIPVSATIQEPAT